MEPNEINNQSTSNQTPIIATNPGTVAPTEPTITPVEPTMARTEPNANDGKKKKNQWSIIALIICVLLAIGGIGFGIYTVVDSNNKVNELNKKVNSLQEENNTLKEQINSQSAGNGGQIEVRNWSSTEIQNGVFSVLDDSGNVIVQSDANGPNVTEIYSCESSSEDTILTCMVNTSDGEGWFLYDVYGDSLASSFDEE